MKLYQLLLILFVCPLFCTAQNNYKPGYMVGLQGDTTKGLINYQEWNLNPATFQFKTSLTGNVKTLTANDVSYVGITGLEYYEAYIGPVSTDETSVSGQGTRDTSFKNETVFLKVLQKGKNVILYSYTDNQKARFFIKNTLPQSHARELIYRIFYKNSRTVTENTFTQQLFEEATKFKVTGERAINTIERADYKTQDLLKVATEINHLSGSDDKTMTTSNKSVQFFVGAGLNIPTFQLNSVQTKLQPTVTSAFPLISAGLDVLVNPNTGRLVFRVELKATENKYKIGYNNIVFPYFPVNHSFTQLQIMVIPQIVYNIYNKDNFKFYVSPGVQVSYLSYSKEKYYQIDGVTPEPANPLYLFRNFMITTSVKAGVKLNKRLDVSASYQLPNNMSYGGYTTIRLRSIYGSINYYL